MLQSEKLLFETDSLLLKSMLFLRKTFSFLSKTIPFTTSVVDILFSLSFLKSCFFHYAFGYISGLFVRQSEDSFDKLVSDESLASPAREVKKVGPGTC